MGKSRWSSLCVVRAADDPSEVRLARRVRRKWATSGDVKRIKIAVMAMEIGLVDDDDDEPKALDGPGSERANGSSGSAAPNDMNVLPLEKSIASACRGAQEVAPPREKVPGGQARHTSTAGGADDKEEEAVMRRLHGAAPSTCRVSSSPLR